MSARSEQSGHILGRTRTLHTGRSNVSTHNSARSGRLSERTRIAVASELMQALTPVVTDRERMRRTGGGNLRQWQEETRAATRPLSPPQRIGSVVSGGVSGFGTLHKSVKTDPVRYDRPAAVPAMLDGNFPLMSPGGAWWKRERFKTKHLAPSARDRPPSAAQPPLEYGSKLNDSFVQGDGRLTSTAAFLEKHKELAGADLATVQRAQLREKLARHDKLEWTRESVLGPEFYGQKLDESVENLMGQLQTDYKGNFERLWVDLKNEEYATKVRGSNQVRNAVRPGVLYEPPPNHPDAIDGYQTSRAKHEQTMNRLYGPASGRTHALPDKPETWNRRDGMRCGIPGIQSFTYYAHQLQNAGYGA
eukprot:CAMPEP_0172638864 /NCGR_PEP_ID=MMETSP1068-20121228/215853_1 /TAXON_ID=35684 /ORGANISM="Pseudopedinella elastica, Strain CCMP716" /LENGTH=361 /DNA_ID=CAMNT_0013451853 /DNA_START=115 /DNA_END=1196 /DNA_ORIENTATION=-